MVDSILKAVSIKGQQVDLTTPQYGTVIIPVGSVVTVDIKVDGKTVETLGPWTATAKKDRNALAQVRVRVYDCCEQQDFIAEEDTL